MSMGLSTPGYYYWRNIEEKTLSKKNEKLHYKVAEFLTKKMINAYEEHGKPKEMNFTIKPPEITKEIKKIPECENITTREVGLIAPLILSQSGFKKDEDWCYSLSGGRRYVQVWLTEHNVESLIDLNRRLM